VCTVSLLWTHYQHQPIVGREGDDSMVDHIFNEARSGELLRELRAEAERARLERRSRQPSRMPRGARTGMLARVVAACLCAAVGAGLQTAN
jgi:hypothetical protein